MKTKYIAKRRKVGGFTLLELLVVVGILAIIAGAIITAYDGFAENAARKTAANTVASMTSTIRTAQTTQQALPDNLESLLTSAVGTPNPISAAGLTVAAAIATDVGGTPDGSSALSSFLSTELSDKLGVRALTNQQMVNLNRAGITQVRYIDAAGDPVGAGNADDGDDYTLAAPGIGTAPTGVTDATATNLADATTMQNIFGPPTFQRGNMGRGFVATIDVPANTSGVADANPDTASTEASARFAVWGDLDPTTTDTSFLNVEVGAEPAARLVALGVGQQCTLIGGPSSNGDTVKLAAAPFYGAVRQNQYNHYIMLVDVTKNPALFVTVVDSRGNNLDQGLNGL